MSASSPKPKTIETEIVIDAPPQKVWDVLMDTEKWKEWNPCFVYVGSPFVVGEPFEIHMNTDGKADTKPAVVHPVITVCDPEKKVLIWKGVLGGAEWVFHGFHSFELIAVEDDTTKTTSTKLLQQEQMHGIMLPLIRLMGQVESTRKGFVDMNDALKKRCEGADDS
jgi:hypothetical protein